jgi:hypothetical protein
MTKTQRSTNRTNAGDCNVLQIPVSRRAERVERDLQRLVIGTLRAVHDAAGADAFDHAATRLLVATAAVLRLERGDDRLRHVLRLIEAVDLTSAA